VGHRRHRVFGAAASRAKRAAGREQLKRVRVHALLVSEAKANRGGAELECREMRRHFRDGITVCAIGAKAFSSPAASRAWRAARAKYSRVPAGLARAGSLL